MPSSKRKKGCLLVAVGLLAVGGFFAAGPIGAAIDLWRGGQLEALVEHVDRTKFEGDSRARLTSIHTALGAYHDSEGQFPAAEGWMKAIETRLQTNDLKPGEGAAKLVRPDLVGQSGQYGYALNRAAAGKYKDDVGKPDAILVFESVATARDATGDPAKDGLPGGLAVTLGGDVVKLPGR